MELTPAPAAEISVESALADPVHFSVWRNDILEIYGGLQEPRDTEKAR
jgi:hypothetical protein